MSEEAKPHSATFNTMKHTLLGAGGLAAALAILSPVKDFFYTRDEAAALVHRVASVETSQKELRRELVEVIDKGADRVIASINEKDQRTNQRMDKLEDKIDNRINSLEASQRRQK